MDSLDSASFSAVGIIAFCLYVKHYRKISCNSDSSLLSLCDLLCRFCRSLPYSSDTRDPNIYTQTMRLLEFNNHGEVSLTKYLFNDIPPYAILSHTWGEDDEEITFQDLTQGVGKKKAGYGKIRFCGKQAAKDGLRYVWIDTCCIDKSNSTELSEALNSMFRWYSDAAKCYVYLLDVPARGPGWNSAFRKSRWFTRGWTLQELLAPEWVEFFSEKGERLGDKKSLGQQVCEITKIPIAALQAKSLSPFPVSMRISWATERETKRQEDKAYSLMGIVGVHMPPIYGEGRDEAFERLHGEIARRSSQQGKLQQVSQDTNWHVEQISTFSTANFSTGLTPVSSQAKTSPGWSSILFL